MSEKKEFPDDFLDWTGAVELLAKIMISHPVTKKKYRISIQQLQSIFTGGGSGSADGGVLESVAAMNTAAQGKFYGVQLPDVHEELNMDHFALICIRGGANDELVQVAIGFDTTMKIYLRGGESGSYSAFSQISGGGSGVETDPVFASWLETNPFASYAQEQWVRDNFAFKDNGIVPPVSEEILLTTDASSYTVTEATADNINVSSTAAAGTITLPILPESKQLKISIKTGSNSVTIAGTAYVAGVVVFAVFDEPTGVWTVDSTLDPVIPDYSDVKVQKRTTTAPQQMQFSYVISGFAPGGGGKGHLIFVDIPGSALSGVYSSLVTFAGTSTIAQKVIEGTALNVVRVGFGSVYHSEYDGVNLASLKFNSIAEVNTGANFKAKLETLTADNRLSESAIKLSTASYNGVNTISLDFSKEVNKITLDASGTLAILIDAFTNVPLIDGQRTVLIKNNRASSVNLSFKTTDLVVGDVTYSFTNLTLPVITVYASKVAEISYLFLFSSATTCQVYITSVAQP